MKNQLFLIINIFIFSIQAQTYTNPVLAPGIFNGKKINSLADPFVLKDIDGTYYLYVTGTGFTCFASKDLVNWTYKGTLLNKRNCKWATTGFWAPEVTKVGSKYFLHYTAGRDDNVKHIGVAVSDNPAGPYSDISNKPFIDHGKKGTIDSDVFVDDDGRTYMYYSNAMSTNPIPGIPGKKRSEIWVVEIAPDFTSIISAPKMLIFPQQEWEYDSQNKRFWNEGSVMLKRNGIYYLMYSANCFCNSNYSVGYATSASPTGPFIKYEFNPILSNAKISQEVSGPGHHCVIKSPDNKELFCVYHSRVNVGKKNSENDGIREINIDRMGFNPDGTLYINGPTVTSQPYPSFAR